MAELLGRTPLFPGEDYLDQIQRTVAVLGTPSADDLSYIGNESALKYVKGLPKRSKQPWKTLFPKANPLALDLLDKMLTFHPDKRPPIEECIRHQYFQGMHDPNEEPVCKAPFDWTFDKFTPTKELLQKKVLEESLSFTAK